jgi:hypothetical protein
MAWDIGAASSAAARGWRAMHDWLWALLMVAVVRSAVRATIYRG